MNDEHQTNSSTSTIKSVAPEYFSPQKFDCGWLVSDFIMATKTGPTSVQDPTLITSITQLWLLRVRYVLKMNRNIRAPNANAGTVL